MNDRIYVRYNDYSYEGQELKFATVNKEQAFKIGETYGYTYQWVAVYSFDGKLLEEWRYKEDLSDWRKYED